MASNSNPKSAFRIPKSCSILVGLALVLLTATCCQSEPEPPRPHKRIVYRQKISLPGESPSKTIKPVDQTETEAQTAKSETKPKSDAKPAGRQPGKETAPAVVALKPPSLPEKEPLIQQIESEIQKPSEEIEKKVAYFYDPKGKLDPFKSILAIEAENRARAEEKVRKKLKKKLKKKKRPPLTALQKVELSQLKLVGIIISPAGNKALVEEASGKGYIIIKGTYIGANFGQVKQILNDRIIVEEEVEDLLAGKMKTIEKVLILQKKLGTG